MTEPNFGTTNTFGTCYLKSGVGVRPAAWPGGYNTINAAARAASVGSTATAATVCYLQSLESVCANSALEGLESAPEQ